MLQDFIQRIGRRNPDCVFEALDPRCKLLIVSLCTLLVIVGGEAVSLGVFLSAAGLAWLARLLKFFTIASLFAVVFWFIFTMVLMYVLKNPADSQVSLFCGIVFRGVSLGVIGLWFAVTTKLRDLTAALEAWRMPIVIILPLTIAVRFIPTLLNESFVIKDSMRLRGIFVKGSDLIKKPQIFFHSYLTLVIIRSLKMADELAAVAETRALASPYSKTVYRPAKFGRNDYLALLLAAAAATAVIITAMNV